MRVTVRPPTTVNSSSGSSGGSSSGSSSGNVLHRHRPKEPKRVAATIAVPPPTAACQAVLDLWCAGDAVCTADVKKDGAAVPLLARRDLQRESGGGTLDGWRCYSPTALDKSRARYVGTREFCTRPQLYVVEGICNGTLSPQPYPLWPGDSPSPQPPPSPPSCQQTDPGPPHNENDALIWPNGFDGVAGFRIPSVVGPFLPDSPAVLAFSEVR